MSNYRSIAVDFPSRIEELLTTFEKPAAEIDREVTLLLALAMPAITVPIERLRKSHPSHDHQGLPDLHALITQLEEESFLGSSLWPSREPSSWSFGGPLQSTEGELDSWPELKDPQPMNSMPSSWQILRHVRNALAHGNIYTTKDSQDIHMLVFLSWVSPSDQRYRYLLASPDEFRDFVANWFRLLAPVHFPSYVIAEESAVA